MRWTQGPLKIIVFDLKKTFIQNLVFWNRLKGLIPGLFKAAFKFPMEEKPVKVLIEFKKENKISQFIK